MNFIFSHLPQVYQYYVFLKVLFHLGFVKKELNIIYRKFYKFSTLTFLETMKNDIYQTELQSLCPVPMKSLHKYCDYLQTNVKWNSLTCMQQHIYTMTTNIQSRMAVKSFM